MKRETGAFSAKTKAIVKARAEGRCERCGKVPRNPEYQHRRPRQRGGTRNPAIAAPSNAVYSCQSCHRWMESMRLDAYALGFLVHSWFVPLEVPVWHWELGNVFLTDDGRYTLEPQ